MPSILMFYQMRQVSPLFVSHLCDNEMLQLVDLEADYALNFDFYHKRQVLPLYMSSICGIEMLQWVELGDCRLSIPSILILIFKKDSGVTALFISSL